MLGPDRRLDNLAGTPIVSAMTDRTTLDADVIIVGGGLNGPALALALAQAGLKVTVLDALPLETRADPEFNGRAYAQALASRRFWQAVGVWPLVTKHVQNIEDILVTDGKIGEGAAPLFLHFDHRELDEGVFGYMIEDRWLRAALHQRMEEEAGVSHRAPAKVIGVDAGLGAASVTLEGGETLTARLVVGCDGRNSMVGRAAGIKRLEWSYDQFGLVCSVEHEKPHQGVAHEYFLPAGPFAILPLPGNVSSLVWTEKTDEAKRVMKLDDAAYEAEIRARFGDFLGEVKLVGGRWAFPLNLSLAQDYVKPRLALVGDAAHGVHPIAGQGLNLGIRDVAALAEVLVDAMRRGEDIGALDVLERYQTWRRFDSTALAFGMDAVNRLFSNDNPAIRLARDIGLAAVNQIAPARRFFMRTAAGLTGDLPRLLQGRPL